MPNITVIILTKNEARHIGRAISAIRTIAAKCVVVDSGSDDETVELAVAAGAEVLSNPWLNYADQFNWALSQLPKSTEWVMRLDADEIVSEELSQEISRKIPILSEEISGVYVPRRMNFLGQRIERGGLFPVKVIRLFRFGKGKCEQRWMDEHIIVDGETENFSGELVDDNRNSLSWWIEKHNSYASREVVDIFNQKHKFIEQETISDFRGHQAAFKRWLKERVYNRLPMGARSFIYFFYRFIIRLGFLEGRKGRSFHVLQGFWYRYLVDMKLLELEDFMRMNEVDPVVAIREVLGIDIGRRS